MENHKKIKVFISYSWATNKDKVEQIAAALRGAGIDTVIDIWDLNPGQDKYTFMEKMVSDPSIDYVLIMCDKSYAIKADSRKGGVGDETFIISPELYGKAEQKKFIPVILEKDDKGNPYQPAYLKSRIYFDFTPENFYSDYKKLVKTLYNEPISSKPPLGEKPRWVSNESPDTNSIKETITQMQSNDNTVFKQKSSHNFYLQFIDMAKKYTVDVLSEDVIELGKNIKEKIYEMKSLRDLYLDVLYECICDDKNITEFITTFFEKIYNELLFYGSDDPGQIQFSYHPASFEHYKFIIWNCFICTITYLWQLEKYREIHTILTHTFFLQEEEPRRNLKARSFCEFKLCPMVLDKQYGQQLGLFSIMASIAIEFTKVPFINATTFSQADVLLCQLSFIVQRNYYKHWFLNTYIYCSKIENMWEKLSSKYYCEKIMPLFNVSTLEDLKKIITENPVDKNYGYDDTWERVPSIPLKIGGHDFSSLP